jgi:GNAT superfamily N-acetyltransferase
VIEIRRLEQTEIQAVDDVLPLHRLDRRAGSTYLVAWDDEDPVGHAHVAWTETELELPEIQDVFVLPERRNEGIGTELTGAAERLVAERGHDRCSISVSVENTGARRLYERLGYRPVDGPPKRVVGTIELRGEPFDVDDTIAYFTKDLVTKASISQAPVRRRG